MDPPPPPPPHGSNQQNRSGGLPPGNYDIFVIPPHSSGSGFLYLPSLNTQRNSFLAGVACTASAFLIWSVVVPVIKEWFNSIITGGGQGVLLLMMGVGVAAWALGKTQAEGSSPGGAPPGTGGSGPSPTGAGAGPAPAPGTGAGPAPQPGPPPTGGPTHGSAHGSTHVPPNPSAGAAPPPRSSWQRPNPHTTGASNAAKNSWEKAREETRKKEEERKRAEEVKRRREEAEKERQRQREKDAKEREERERKERAEKAEQERKAKAEQERKEKAEQERKEKAEQERREKEEQERKEKAEQERKEREAAAAARAKEREREREREKGKEKEKEKAIPKKPPYPTARTETEDDAYSFRPYDRPKRPAPKSGSTASTYSESSYAASQTTARTTPPPSHRGPYSTKDPDKIIIKAVYSFNNAFQRTPVAQLISGQGNVTDGLILRITTEGLFIDDDVRGVPQREWDVKAWTMKAAEVWCPHFLEDSTSFAPGKRPFPFVSPRFGNGAASRQSSTSEQSETTLRKMTVACLRNCKYVSRSRGAASSVSQASATSSHSSRYSTSVTPSSTTESHSSTVTDDTAQQSGEMSGIHVLRASIRDQEGKKYVFILDQTEGWKVAVGLQRLRRGTQVRAMGVSGIPPNETKALIENLGWA